MTNKGEQKPPLFIIAGATATGKSAIAFELAKTLNAEIISADSMQVYRGMEIGTAQPSEAEKKQVVHHCTGHIEPNEEYDVFRFVEEAESILSENQERLVPTIICGGTGMFLRQLGMGIFDGAPKDENLRKSIEEEYDEIGEDKFREKLKSVDEKREKEISPNDKFRLVRAMEVYRSTGTAMSEWHRRHQEEQHNRVVVYNVLFRSKEVLEIRIRSRIEKMIDAGWIEEARRLKQKDLPENAQALKALGYKQLFEYFDDKKSLDDTIDEIHLRTRQFAKRQRTWFRGVKQAMRYDLDATADEDILEELLESYYEKISQSGNSP